MSSIYDPILANDPVLKELSTRTLSAMKLVALKVAAHVTTPRDFAIPADPSSVERRFMAWLNTRKPAARARALERMKPELAARVAAPGFGGLMRSAAPILPQMKTVARPPGMTAEWAQKLAQQIASAASAPASPPAKPSSSAPVEGHLLQFRLRKLRCATAMGDGLLGGDDDILLGGVTIDETGDLHKIAQFPKSHDDAFEFNDSDKRERVFSPPHVFTSFDIREGGEHWPKRYVVMIAMAEADSGGFADFVSELFGQVKETVIGLFAAAGSVVLPGFGTLIGMLVGAAFVAFVDWLISLFRNDDDLFTTVNEHVTLTSRHHVFHSGTQTCDEKTVNIGDGDGARYVLHFDWRIVH